VYDQNDVLMNKLFKSLFFGAMVFCLSACGDAQSVDESQDSSSGNSKAIEKSNDRSDASNSEPDFSVRCAGLTSEDKQCKNNTGNENYLCHLHQDQEGQIDYDSLDKAGITVRCSDILNNGTQCKRRTKSKTGKCYQHQ